MSRLAPFVLPEHHQQISVVAERPAPANAPTDLMSTIAIVVAIMLLGFAAGAARKVLSTVWEMTRVLFDTLGVVLLLVLSMVVLIGALVVSTVGR
jgi:hypothetical protein